MYNVQRKLFVAIDKLLWRRMFIRGNLEGEYYGQNKFGIITVDTMDQDMITLLFLQIKYAKLLLPVEILIFCTHI